MGFDKAHSALNHTAYAKADSMADVLAGFSRVRTVQRFMMNPSGLAAEVITCPQCHRRVEPGQPNKGVYSPKHRRAVVMHYDCSWEATLKGLFGD